MTIGEIDSIEFDFEDKRITALVRCKEQAEGLIMAATIMNGELEKRLFGFHQFVVKDKDLMPFIHCEDPAIASLQDAVGMGLKAYLNSSSWNIQPVVKAEVEYAQLPATF